MRKPRCYAEVYNDVWDTVVNVFKVMRDPATAKELERVLRLTPYARHDFLQTGEIDLAKIADPIEKARLTIFRSFAGFGSASTNSKYATGFRASSNRSGTTPAHDWANYPQNVDSFIQRLSGVTIKSKDYSEVIKQQDSTDTLFYADPPYPHCTRNMKRGNAAYAHELTDNMHVQLADQLRQIKGMAVVSGYRCGLYDELFSGWVRLEKNAFADGASPRVECLWINENAMQRRAVS